MRRFLTALVAGAVALPLVAATGDVPPTGSASTQMTALEFSVGSVMGVTVMDGRTSASTVGGPSGAASLQGLRIGDTSHAAVSASTAGSPEDTTETLDWGSSGLAMRINPLTATVASEAGEVVAGFSAATSEAVADLSDIAGVLSARVDSLSATSTVTATRASATQGVTVSDIGLTLGGLVAALDQLPLDALLDVIDALGLTVSVDPNAAVAQLDAAVAAVQDAADALDTATTTTVADLDALAATHAAGTAIEPQVDGLQTTYDALVAMDPTTATAADILLVMSADEIAACGISDLAIEIVTNGTASVLATLIDCVAAEMEALTTPTFIDPTAFDPTSAHTDLLGALDAIVAEAATLVTADASVGTAIAALETAVDDLAAVVAGGDLATLVDEVIGLLPTLDGTPLVTIEELDVSVSAIASPDGASQATVGCSIEIAVLATQVGPQSCEGGLGALLSAVEALNAAIIEVQDLLGTLPVSAGDVSTIDLDLLSDPTDGDVCSGGAGFQRICDDGDTYTATAGIRVMDLTIPSLTLDPSGVTDLVGDALDAVQALDPAGSIDGALAAVGAALSGTPFAGSDAALQTAGATASGTVASAAGAAQSAIGDVRATLDASPIGDLVGPVATPAISLAIDPVSTASFTRGVAGVPDTPEEEPEAPAPDPTPSTPSLPATGGGAVLMGLLSMAGAFALRRRD